MHAGLVRVLDDAVVPAVYMDGCIRQLATAATIEAGQRNGLHANLCRCRQCPHNVLRIARRADRHQHIPPATVNAQREGEDVGEADIVADSGDDLYVRRQTDNARAQRRVTVDPFLVIADHVAGNGGRAAVAAAENGGIPLMRARQNDHCRIQLRSVDRGMCRRQLRKIMVEIIPCGEMTAVGKCWSQCWISFGLNG